MAAKVSFDAYMGWVNITNPNQIPEDARVISANDLLRYEKLGKDAAAKFAEIDTTIDGWKSDTIISDLIVEETSETRYAVDSMVKTAVTTGVAKFQAKIDAFQVDVNAVPAKVEEQIPPLVAKAIADDDTITEAAALAVDDKIAGLDLLQADDSRLPQTYENETEIDVGWADNNDKLVFGLDVARGVAVAPILESQEVAAGSINGIAEVTGITDAGSGLLFAYMDKNDLVWHPLAVDEDGRTPQFVIDDIASRMPTQSMGPPAMYQPVAHAGSKVPLAARNIVSGPDVVGFGHSMLAGAGGGGTNVISVLAAETGLTCRNASVGGDSSVAIIARQGGNPFMLLPQGGSIPASGSVVIPEFPVDGGGASWPLLQGSGTDNAKIMGTLAGVRGEIVLTRPPGAAQYVRDPGDVYTFVRSTPGAAVSVTRPQPFYYEYTEARRGDTAVFWLGRNNNSNYNRVFADLKRGIQHMTALDKRFIVLADTNGANEGSGTTTYNNLAALNALYHNEYGRRYIDVRSYLVKYGLADAGITPTTQDTADMAADIVPTSLRSDYLHLNAAGYTIVGKLIAARMRELGWII